MEEKKRNVTAYSLGCVYAVEFGNVVKIGFTTDFENRIKSLKLTLRYRNEKEKIGKMYCSNEMHYARRAEALLHKRFKNRRIEGTELFRITFEEAEKAIKEVEQLKLYSDDDRERHLEAERKFEKIFNSIFIDNGESEWETINGIDVVLAENVREALEWDSVPHMVRGLKDGKEVLKVRVSDLKSEGWDFTRYDKMKKNTLYVYFLTRQGVARLIATHRPHGIKDNSEFACKLDKLQDWIFGEVLPEVMATGRYSGRSLVAGQHAITEMPTKLSDALRLMADEYDAHELTIKTVNEHNSTIKEQLFSYIFTEHP